MVHPLIRRSVDNRRLGPSLAVAVTMVLIAVTAVAWQGRLASGHAEPEVSAPAAGSTVSALPPAVVIVFSEEVSPDGVQIRVIGPDGARVDAADTALDLNDMSRRRASVTLMPSGGDGVYTVEWEAVSASDGHGQGGAYTFVVGPATTPVATSAASPAASPGASPGASPVGSPDASPIASPAASPAATADAG